MHRRELTGKPAPEAPPAATAAAHADPRTRRQGDTGPDAAPERPAGAAPSPARAGDEVVLDWQVKRDARAERRPRAGGLAFAVAACIAGVLCGIAGIVALVALHFWLPGSDGPPRRASPAAPAAAVAAPRPQAPDPAGSVPAGSAPAGTAPAGTAPAGAPPAPAVAEPRVWRPTAGSGGASDGPPATTESHMIPAAGKLPPEASSPRRQAPRRSEEKAKPANPGEALRRLGDSAP